MSAFSEKTFDAELYSKFRPTYPEAFYDMILEYHKQTGGGANFLLDIGCGPGEASLPLIGKFRNLILTDMSSTMISRARKNCKVTIDQMVQQKASNPGLDLTIPASIKVEQSASENLKKVISKDGTIDLVIAAECAHWFDWEKWLDEMARVLKPSGTLVFFSYCDPVFPDEPQLNKIYDDFTYTNPKFIAKYWQQPGRNHLRTLNRKLNDALSRDDRFENVKIRYYDPTSDDPSMSNAKDKMTIRKTYTLEQFCNYVDTWSASHEWNNAHIEEGTTAGHEMFKLITQATNWNEKSQLTLDWRTVYAFSKRANL